MAEQFKNIPAVGDQGQEKEPRDTIDFEKIKPQNENEAKFFELLKRNKKVIFDWGYHAVWVLEDDKDEKNSAKYQMYGDDLEKRADVFGVTSADLVYLMELNGISVDIRNTGDTFKQAGSKESFMKKIHLMVKETKAENGIGARQE